MNDDATVYREFEEALTEVLAEKNTALVGAPVWRSLFPQYEYEKEKNPNSDNPPNPSTVAT